MLIDGITLPASATISGIKFESGATFPASPDDGALYRLTAPDSGKEPGTYTWSDDVSDWVPMDARALEGEELDITVPAPTGGNSPVNRDYIDQALLGLNSKSPVRCASVATIGTLLGTLNVDGVQTVNGDRVLVKDQSTASQNGIYIVGAGAWSRAVDADGNPEGEVKCGMFCIVQEGTVNAGKGFLMTTADPITVGTTGLEFTQFPNVPSSPYDIATSRTGLPEEDEVLLDFVAPRGFTIPVDFSSSVAKALSAATASAVFIIKKNGSQIGTFTFAASGTTATWSTGSAETFSAGDRLQVVAPGAADATLADIAFTIAAVSS